MKPLQQSSNLGLMTMLGGFLAIFADVKIDDFMTVFNDMTFSQLLACIIPFITGIAGMLYNEEHGRGRYKT